LASITVGAVLAGTGLTFAGTPDWIPLGGSSTGGEPAEAPTVSAPPSVPPTPTVATPSTAPSTAAAPAAPSAAPTARAPKPPGPAAAGVVGAVVAATNAERAAAGCDPLKVDGRLNTAAQRHSADMASRQTMSHTGGNGSSFDERIEAAGYPRPAAENIAYGQDSAASVVAAWMDSEGHRRNILNCSYTAIGVGYDPRGDYWTQNFGF
jgi:uncharacterized protein YkwD